MAGARLLAIDRVFTALAAGGKSAPDIADALNMPYAMVNRALRQLQGDGFVRVSGERDGRRVLWEQDPAGAQGDMSTHAERASIVPARQIGMQRDGLVAALFGPARAGAAC